MAKLHELQTQFQEVDQKWNVIFLTNNSAHDTTKIGSLSLSISRII
jgi:hypothetical protein